MRDDLSCGPIDAVKLESSRMAQCTYRLIPFPVHASANGAICARKENDWDDGPGICIQSIGLQEDLEVVIRGVMPIGLLLEAPMLRPSAIASFRLMIRTRRAVLLCDLPMR